MSINVTNAATTPAKMCITEVIATRQYHPHSSSSVGNNEMARNVKESDYQFSIARNPGVQLFPHLDDERNFAVHRRSLGTIRLQRRFRQRGIDKVSGRGSHIHYTPVRL
eukprot:302410_1